MSSFRAIKIWTEGHSNLLLVLALVCGLFSPWVSVVPAFAIFLLLGGMIYFSCARMRLADLRRVDPQRATFFYVARFLILPIVFFGFSNCILPEFSEAVLLLSLMPPGASVASLAGIFGGNVTLAAAYTVISSVLVPLTVTVAFAALGGKAIGLAIPGMFVTLCAVIFLPALLYFGVTAKIPRIRDWTGNYSRFGSVVLIVVMTFVIIGKQRDTILFQPVSLVVSTPLLAALFLFYYAFGWFLPAAGGHEGRVSQTLSSGAMNNGLAIGLAATYFSSETSLTMILSEVPWVVGLALFEGFLKNRMPLP